MRRGRAFLSYCGFEKMKETLIQSQSQLQIWNGLFFIMRGIGALYELCAPSTTPHFDSKRFTALLSHIQLTISGNSPKYPFERSHS